MSLTLPTAYSNTSKLGNIQENWIVQLGFYNGDAEGSGEGGWDAVLDTDGDPNLINKLGSELVQDGNNPDHRVATWTMRDNDGNSDGWDSGSPSPYSDDEISSMINTLTGNDIDAGLHYSLTFTVGVATLSLTIGGGDLTGNTADEIFVAKGNYAVGTHTITFTATADRSHLWFTANTVSAGNGTLDDVTLKLNGYSSAATSIIVDDGTVFQVGDYIKIESEIMKLTAAPSGNTLTVARGAMGTTAATHLNNTALYWNNFTPIALADTTIDDVFYRGTITNKPSIRSSIDLASSTAKTGNISLNVINFQFKGDDFSAELFLGTRKYINREIRIYSQLNGDTALANCLQIYQGRLTDITHDDASISLQITEQRPWDFITMPQSKSETNTFVPVVYGDFTPNTCRHGAYVPNDSLRLFPAPMEYVTQTINCIAPRSLNGASGNEGRLHYWDKTAEQFCPLLSSNGTAYSNDISTTINSINYSTAPLDLHRAYVAKPRVLKKDFTAGGWSSWSDTVNTGNAVDDRYNTPSTSTSTTSTISLSIVGGAGAGTSGEILFLNPLSFEGKAEYMVLTVTGKIEEIAQTGNAYLEAGGNIDYTISLNGILGAGTLLRTRSTTTNNSTFTGSSGIVTSASSDFKTNFNNDGGWDDDDLQLLSYIEIYDDSYTGTSTAEADFVVYDVIQTTRAKYEDMESKISSAIKLKFLYLGCNGLTESWTGGSSSIQYGHEAHRDLLIRFAGYTTTDPTNWSALNTDRSLATWKIRWWELEPVDLKKALEQLQYEFGFIFKLRADGTGSYVHILQTSELSAVQTFTKDDIASLKINNTPFSNLLTKMEINYEKHPAEKLHLSSVTSSNATARSSYNIQAKENIKEVSLDMNVGTPNTSGQTDGNADFYSYYDNIFGDIKKIISCDIVNPAKGYSLETGDIIQFSNTAGEMPVEPFGDNWADYYMITDLKRSPGKVSITAREVG